MTNNSLLNSSTRGFFAGVDRVAILLYFAIVMTGCICITSASYDDMAVNHLDFSHFYVKQVVWMFVSFLAATVVLLIDASSFHKYSYLLYMSGVGLLFMALIFGREVNGAKSWFELGAMRFQPVEVAKITTSITLARVMSEYSFSITNLRSLLKVVAIVALPLSIIVLQNDTGSGIVFGSFFFVLYREGLSKWLCVPMFLMAAIFTLSFVLSPIVLLASTSIFFLVVDALMTRRYRYHLIYAASLTLSVLLIKIVAWFGWDETVSSYSALLIMILISLIPMLWIFVRRRMTSTFIISLLFLSTTVIVRVSDFVFTSILRPHQQNRIMSFLGMVSDPLGTDYNVNQSKIAIGSGGLFGKGFLEGTQIRYGFVPERHTDFIFCDLAEEWGFLGVLFLLGCFFGLILKLINMGERQKETFGRVYCYCVASILLFHILVNVGMTIGLMPVMGIPLPFMSYGGSSLLAFTIMLFIAFRLDATNLR